MTLRYQSGVTNISSAATTLAHGLTGTPDEYFLANHASPSSAYWLGVSSTNIVLACGPGAQVTANVFAAVNHSIIK